MSLPPRRLFVVWLLALLSVPAWAQAPRVTLDAPLADGLTARHASGAATGVARHDPTETGHWSVRGDDDSVAWLGRGNIAKDRGTLAFFFRPAWAPDDAVSRALIADELEFSKKPLNAMRLWKWDDRGLRFDLRSDADRYLMAPMAALSPGEWHHLAVTWDHEVGTRLYVDGRRMAEAEYAYTPGPMTWLHLGGGDWAPGLGDYRGLVVLDSAADDAGVARLAAGDVPFDPAPKAPPAAISPGARDGKPVFHATFDGSLTADAAGERVEPQRAEGVGFVDSPFGRAAHFPDGAVLQYPGRIPHDRGAISMWVRPDWAWGEPDGDRFFLREAPPDQPGDDCRWIWFWQSAGSRRVRFDLREPSDAYRSAIGAWAAGEWHHLVLQWDAADGLAEAYLDGRRVPRSSDSGKIFSRLAPWTPQPKPHFWVGSRDGLDAARAAIDELVVYDAPLEAEAIAAAYRQVAPLEVWLPTNDAAPGASLPVSVVNRSGAPVQGVDLLLSPSAGGEPIRLPHPDVTLAPGAEQAMAMAVPAEAGATWTVSAAPAGGQPGGSTSLFVTPPEPAPAAAPTETLVERIDLTADLPADRFTDDGQSRVVDSPIGRYREAGDARNSRFAVRLRPKTRGAWHRLEWTWPDDKPRTADVILNRDQYDVHSGTLAGGEYANTGAMRTQSAWFWARSNDDAAIFMTAEAGRPAAAAELRLYELSGPPPAIATRGPAIEGAKPRRVGLYYEDPVLPMNFGDAAAFPGFANVADRLIAYMEAHGLNTLYYPAVWYHGPLYPSASQNRERYPSRPHPEDFVGYLLRRFNDRGLRLVLTFNVHDLPSFADAEANEARVRAGAETPVTVMWNTGLKLSGWHGTPGDLNPLDPEVAGAVQALVEEIAERYGAEPAFDGLLWHLPLHSLLWFGSLETGYNDVNLRGFEADTGIDLGLDWSDPFRANVAYRKLMGVHREAWIDWRAERIAQQWAHAAATLREARPDLTLAINPYTSIDNETPPADLPPEQLDHLATLREYGADLGKLARIPNLEILHTLAPGLYRWHRGHGRTGPETRAHRVYNLHPSSFEPFAQFGKPFGVQLHDKYWENDIGRADGLPGLKAWGQPEMGWRVSTLVPPAPYGLEDYAAGLGYTDLMTAVKGGFVVGTVGIEDHLTPWALAFGRLPAVPFADLPELVDPVRGRAVSRPDGEWAYVQNLLPVPLSVTLRVDGGGPLTDIATGAELSVVGGGMSLELPGYGLAGLWSPAGGARVVGGAAAGHEGYMAELRSRLAALRAALGGATAADRELAAPRIELADRFLAEDRPARAAVVLEEPWVQRLTAQ